MKNRGLGFAHTARFISRSVFRNASKTLLITLLAAIFVIGITSINLAVINNENGLSELYKTITVTMDIVKVSASSGSDGFIYRSTIDRILETGYIRDYYVQGDISLYSVQCVGNEKGEKPVRGTLERDSYAVCVDDIKIFLEGTGSGIDIHYLDGYDENMFTADWYYEEGTCPPVIVPQAQYDLYTALNDPENEGSEPYYLKISVNSGQEVYSSVYRIAGCYEGLISLYKPNYIIVPTSAFLNWFEDIGDGHLMVYSVANFTIDPEHNSEMQEFRSSTDSIISRPDAASQTIRSVIWDSELRMVAEPMENSIRLLKILYPVVAVVSVLIAVGVCVLFTMLSAKEAAIMHVQGTSKGKTRMILTLESLITCVIGLMIGFAVMYVYMRAVHQEGTGVLIETLFIAAAYFASAAIGSAIASVFVTNRSPIELLQVKE